MNTVVALLFVCCFNLIADSTQQAPTPQQLLDAAHKVSDLTTLGAYVLRGTVVVNPGGKDERRGKLIIARDHDRARLRLDLNGRIEERVVSGDKLYVVPGQGTLYAIGLSEFDRSWDPGGPQRFSIRATPSFGRVHAEKSHERDAWCVEEKSRASKDRLCFDAATSVLLRDGSSGKDFLDYALAGTQLYPQKVKIFDRILVPIEVDQISVTPAPLTDEIFKVPDNAVEVETCEAKQLPEAKSTPEPDFPITAREAGRQARVVVYALITKEGRVSAVQVLSTDSYGFGRNVEEKVKAWRFKPAMCNGHPVATEMNVEVDFRL